MSSQATTLESTGRAEPLCQTSGWRRLAGDGLWSLLDQGLFAISNFGLNVALVRLLAPDAYGLFTTAYGGFLLIGAVHAAILINPMMVLGSRSFRHAPAAYLSVLWRWNLALVGGITALACGAALVLALLGSPLGGIVASLSLCGAATLTLWLARQGCYFHGRSRWAAGTGLLYLGLLGLGIWALARFGSASPSTALLVLGGACAMAAAPLWWRLLRLRGMDTADTSESEIRRFHLRFGRAELVSAVANYLNAYIPQFVLPLVLSFSAAGQYRALIYLVMPFMMALAAFQRVWVTHFSAEAAWARVRQRARTVHRFYMGGLALWAAAMLIGGQWLVGLLYGARIQATWFEIACLIGLVVCNGFNSVRAGLLVSRGRPELVTRACLGALIAVAVSIYPLASTWGVQGAFGSALLAPLISGAIVYRAVRTIDREESSLGSANTR